ncbi:MAG: hypothetical protein M9916_01395 [Crocinitomicaceae bacterium]|nr:hypothetical protein [Crocinitomicaceae bacterium]
MKTIQKIVVHFLILSFFFGIVKNTVVSSIYNCNKDLFVTLFCENQDNPEMHCDGKCAISKMEKEKHDEETNNTLKKLQIEIIALVQTIDLQDYLKCKFTEQKQEIIPSYSNCYSFESTISSLKPPIFA